LIFKKGRKKQTANVIILLFSAQDLEIVQNATKYFTCAYTSRGHGYGFLTTEFLPIAALLNQLRSLLCA